MTHHPMSADSDNALCPNCDTKFGYVVKDNKVICPMCLTEQELPVIMTGDMEYHCFDCGMDFTAPDSNPRCLVCHAVWKEPPVT